jgi:hypothetical protein
MVRSRRLVMIQQGQVFKLKTKGSDGQPLWAYRYRLESRRSERPQVGGFTTRVEAEKALRKMLDRPGREAGGRRSRLPSSSTSASEQGGSEWQDVPSNESNCGRERCASGTAAR